ncbi:MAG: hypothetical protein GEU95_25310 [Rhizobiales bacterium]|nr:hypothetical protein [Hyphomicrobiales bacterium]
MPRLLFTETRVVQQADGLGETYQAGKVYELPAASCERWKARGVAVDAPAEAVPETVSLRIVPARRGKYGVVDAAGHKINSAPLTKAEAEALRDDGAPAAPSAAPSASSDAAGAGAATAGADTSVGAAMGGGDATQGPGAAGGQTSNPT